MDNDVYPVEDVLWTTLYILWTTLHILWRICCGLHYISCGGYPVEYLYILWRTWVYPVDRIIANITFDYLQMINTT